MLGKRTINSGLSNCSNEWTPFVILLLPIVVSACIISRWNTVPHNPLLAAIIIIPLFLAIRLLSPSKAALGGFLWSFVLCFHTVTVAVAPDGRFLAQEFLLLTVPALYVYAGAHYTRSYGFQPLTLALGWIVVELVLHFSGYRQGLLSSCCGNGFVQRVIADFLGYGFVAFAVALINAAAVLLTARLIKHRACGFRPLIIPVIPCVQSGESIFPIGLLPVSLNRPRAPPH
ncbi:MAG: hypothetical protein PHR28_06220 [candidate division Zixibacteria bacterium]|nr:hypothetical protein [candidate division Zixibacteria bacterium]